MLPDSEDEGIVYSESGALRLRDVEIVALGMRCRVTEEELIGRVVTAVGDGDGEGEGVRIVPDGVHEAAFAGVDFQRPGAAVAGEVGFHSVAFLAVDPFCLCEGAGRDGVPTFEDVAVGVASVGTSFHFCKAFDVWWDGELDVNQLEVLDTCEAGVVINKAKVVFEVGRTGTRESHENIGCDRGTDMLLLHI